MAREDRNRIEERRHDVLIVVLQEGPNRFDTYFTNPPANWHIPSSGVPAIRRHQTQEAALQAGRDFIDAHQPTHHETHDDGFYTLYVKLWYGIEKWVYNLSSSGSGGNSKAIYDSPEAALKAGRLRVAEKIAEMDALMKEAEERRKAQEER